jgi:hypothetical protein
MPFRIGIALGAVFALVSLGGCANAGSAAPSYMQACMAKASTEMERSECAWSNAARMASGR